MAMQEFLASYAVEVDEDGVKRLQTILQENRTLADEIAGSFAAAKSQMDSLFSGGQDNKDDNSLADNLRRNAQAAYDSIMSVRTELTKPMLDYNSGSLYSIIENMNSQTREIGSALGAMTDNLLRPVNASLEGSIFDIFSKATENIRSSFSEEAAGVVIPVSLDMSEAEENASSFVDRLQALRPKLSVNTTGITSAVSSAVSSVRSMMSSLSFTIPVKVAISGVPGNGQQPSNNSPSGLLSGSNLPMFAEGARVSSPTLAMVAETGNTEYIIPAENDSRAVPLLRSLLGELSESARSAIFDDLLSAYKGVSLKDIEESLLSLDRIKGSVMKNGSNIKQDPSMGNMLSSGIKIPGLDVLEDRMSSVEDFSKSFFSPHYKSAGNTYHSVEAPVTIQVSSPYASPEDVGRSVYNIAQRQLLRTMKGVFS